MTGKELDDSLENLLSTGKGKFKDTQVPAKFTTKDFIQDVLSLMPDEQQDTDAVPEAA